MRRWSYDPSKDDVLLVESSTEKVPLRSFQGKGGLKYLPKRRFSNEPFSGEDMPTISLRRRHSYDPSTKKEALESSKQKVLLRSLRRGGTLYDPAREKVP